ncbi:hypothetical protein BD324DRAFT_628152 [Kockovaella imperatae]|uniref:Uncharacterized protein n=1 Tax=Kockovaella imperatae TaxID=4999 RepID=A0A1Y1UE60_9TREE|nr:hypothetical protein BD324DRAFT_628152 [Kockovaella imperatae]ORX36279.1 hypothetical protein BD324DRAFT_628152 [Kockovaella imperatae]
MDRQLEPPLLIRTVGHAHRISTLDTYNHLSSFIMHLPPSTSRTQIERVTDALGVECGVVDVTEEERREKERARRREEKRKLKRLQREAEAAEAEAAEASEKEGAQVEEEEERKDVLDEEDEMEGGVGDGDVTMDDRGDVEYGDVVDEDEDEPDNDDQGLGQDDSDE